MTPSGISDQVSPDSIKVGAWLFRHRTAAPLPFALALLAIPAGPTHSWTLIAAGVALTLGGEAVRIWAVNHIGVISRTRSDRLGPLITTGPFGMVRNPLYLGNIAIWVGFGLTAQLPWVALATGVLLAAEYHAIVLWEEQLLESRIGEGYRNYTASVRRWWPKLQAIRRGAGYGARHGAGHGARHGVGHGARHGVGHGIRHPTLFSERGTLIAIAAGYVLLWLKARF